MNAVTAFENRKQETLDRLSRAEDAQQAITAATMALERIAGDLAQDEADALSRQRQQAVMAIARRAPLFLRPARAEGQMVLAGAQAHEPIKRADLGMKAVGGALLACLAVYEAIDGQWLFALLQLAGGALVACGGRNTRNSGEKARAQGVLRYDSAEMLRAIGELCQAADVCVSDLALIEQSGPAARLSGTADEAMLDLLVSLMEAKATGREDVAMRSLDQAETYLRMLGVEPIFFDRTNAEHARLFDVLPTLSGERTIRPALMKDGRLIRRGVAACAARQAETV